MKSIVRLCLILVLFFPKTISSQTVLIDSFAGRWVLIWAIPWLQMAGQYLLVQLPTCGTQAQYLMLFQVIVPMYLILEVLPGHM